MLNKGIFLGEIVLDNHVLFMTKREVNGLKFFEVRSLYLRAINGVRKFAVHAVYIIRFKIVEIEIKGEEIVFDISINFKAEYWRF